MAIPVIDFSKLHGPERDATMAQIANGCEEWGFFQLVNHGIPKELLETVKKVSSECYKMREEGFMNSLPVHLLNDVLEGNKTKEELNNVDWEDVFTLLDDNEWPSQPPHFKETMVEFRREVKKLAEKMMEILDENLGLAKGHIKRAFCGGGDEQLHEPFFGTKVSHYPPCPHPEMVAGLRAHTDAGGVILLFQDDQVGGLRILKEGQWIDVQPVPNAIVIDTGDQIEVVSNGRYKSVWHRVLAMKEGNRRSIASFYNPSLQAAIAPATELVQASCEADIAAYPKFVFGDYMDVYAKKKFHPKEPRFQAVASM